MLLTIHVHILITFLSEALQKVKQYRFVWRWIGKPNSCCIVLIYLLRKCRFKPTTFLWPPLQSMGSVSKECSSWKRGIKSKKSKEIKLRQKEQQANKNIRTDVRKQFNINSHNRSKADLIYNCCFNLDCCMQLLPIGNCRKSEWCLLVTFVKDSMWLALRRFVI